MDQAISLPINDNATIAPQQNTSSSNKRKSSKPKRSSKHMDMDMDREERISLSLDDLIQTKKRMIDKVNACDVEEFYLNDETNLEQCINRLDERSTLLEKAVELDYKQRAYVDFEDSEINGELSDVLNTVPNPIIIYTMDLEPMNQMLTDFINKPSGFLPDYIMPEFDDVRSMLKKIQENDDCPLYEHVVPREGTEAFDEYIKGILGNVKERIRANRMNNMIGYLEEAAQSCPSSEQTNTTNEQSTLHEAKPSSSSETFTEKLNQLKQGGFIIKEEEPPKEETEDLAGADVQSDIGSDISASICNGNQTPQIRASSQDNDIIELGDSSDSENSDSGDSDLEVLETIPTVKQNGKVENKAQEDIEVDSNTEMSTKNDINMLEDTRDTIATGESACSPPISPMDSVITTRGEEQVKAKSDSNEDGIIYID